MEELNKFGHPDDRLIVKLIISKRKKRKEEEEEEDFTILEIRITVIVLM